MKATAPAIVGVVLIIALSLFVGLAVGVGAERRANECKQLVVAMVDEGTSTADMARGLKDARCRVRDYIPPRGAESEVQK